jgi:hypothetical protein
MHFSTGIKGKTAAIALVLLMASAIVMLTVPVKAQTETPVSGPLPSGATPSVTVDVTAHLSFRPNVIGVGQTFLVNMWTTPAVHASRYHPNYTVVITKPDASQYVITMQSYKADATAWFEYVADKVGTWKLKFYFPGTYFPGGKAAGGFMQSGSVTLASAYYNPTSSPELTLTVQTDIVPAWSSALPTDYWTRPVHVENREWWTIAGNYPATGYVGGGAVWDELYPDTNPGWTYTSFGMNNRLVPWVEAPDSAHIVWKRQGSIAGIIGGQAGIYGYSSDPGQPALIYAGRCYDSYTKPGQFALGASTAASATTYFRCYDLRTGELYWEYPVTTASGGGFFFASTTGLIPTMIEYVAPSAAEMSQGNASATWSANLMRIDSGRLYKWNPWSGALTCNVSLSPVSSAVFYAQSSGPNTDPMALSVVSSGGKNWLINWTTRGTSATFSSRIKSNTSYAMASLPSMIDFTAGLGAAVSGITKAEVYVGENLTGYDLWTGQKLWSKNITEPVYSGLCDIVDHGKLATLSANGYYTCYDLRTGAFLWKGEQMDYPWGSAGFGAYSAISAYGLIFRESMDGIYAYNWTNGKIQWKYEAPANPFEVPYTGKNGSTVLPFYSFGVGGKVADGKFFTWTYEHTETWPVTRGWSIHAIDVFTGKGVWNVTGCMIPGAIADGYLTAADSFDGYMYVFGKGKSATTVTAGPKTIALGEKVVVEGTVMDLSPAQPNTPCVSAGSMTLQMDYLHMQMPIGGLYNNVTMTGVQVYLTAIDPNGNPEEIGTATTNAYYGTFSKAWTPKLEGDYTVIASFTGDASYASSGAATAISVGPAPTVEPTPTPPETPVDNMPLYLLGATIAIIIAIAIVGILLLRKK